MGSRTGIKKIAAKRCGVSVDVWRSRRLKGEKFCWDCREWKPFQVFRVDRSRGDGRASQCKPCNSIASTASRYGITKQEVLDLLAKNECEICGLSDRKWEIDHDHETGLVRGLLCSRCNSALGMFLESPEIMNLSLIHI